MDVQTALDTGRETLLLALFIATPMLCVGLVVGVSVSILQAVTQIQEMTLTFVPKIVAMGLAGMLFLPYIMNKLITFAAEMFGPMPVP